MYTNDWWQDPRSAWWAKIDRAKHHINALAADIDSFLESTAYEVVPEPGEQPDETIYRLRMHHPIPVYFSTTIGDTLHNLRSALDCAAYEMAQRHVGRDLTEKEELACEFPIRDDPEKLAKFFSAQGRQALYGPRDRQAIRDVQPARLHDEVARRGVKELHPREQEVTYDPLWLLSRLSNIDKHRRLHLTAWWPGITYWGSDEPSRRRWRWGQPPYEDGRILGRLIDDSEHPEPPATLHQEMSLRILYPGAERQDVARLLEAIHQDITYRVIPRLLDPSRGTA
jgi:hypothetical protein